MGTNSFVVPIFEAIRQSGHEIMAVFTRAPKPVGRKQILTPSPVHNWALEHNLPLHTSIKEYNYSPDMVVVISYGVILRDDVLNSAPVVNIHPSLLPLYRGPSPIRTAIYNGDNKSGVCLMQVTSEMDAGDIYECREFDIDINDTNETVENRVSQISIDMLLPFLDNPESYNAVPQDGVPTFTKKWTGNDEIIDWSRGNMAVHNQVRALGAGRTKINGLDVKILSTRLDGDKLDILQLQPSGKKPMDWRSFINGLRGETVKIGV